MVKKTAAVIGLGYIGLPTAAILASPDLQVIGTDINPDLVDRINQGRIKTVEPGLAELVQANVREGYLRASTQLPPADIFFISVPTPIKQDKSPDLSAIKAAGGAIAKVLQTGNLVIIESTVPVGTTEYISVLLSRHRSDLTFPHTQGDSSDIRIAHCPERVLPGRILQELASNNRIIGGLTPSCSKTAREVYQAFVTAEISITDARVAEMCKLAENSFRDVNIAFANELSHICEQLEIDVWELIRLTNRHPRVQVLQPGCGVGGHCIAMDPWFIVNQAPEQARLIKTAREINNSKPDAVVKLISDYAKRLGLNSIICYGAAFKPDIDDFRESPAVSIILQLIGAGYSVQLIEPNTQSLPKALADSGCQLSSLQEVSKATTAVQAILVAHREFKNSALIRNLEHTLDFVGVLATEQ